VERGCRLVELEGSVEVEDEGEDVLREVWGYVVELAELVWVDLIRKATAYIFDSTY
jgi:hypothetical protein